MTTSEDFTTITLKRCPKCGEEKPLTPENYNRDPSTTSGFRSACKVCVNEHRRQQYLSIAEQERERLRVYYRAHPEKVRKKVREYRLNNPDKMREKTRRRRDKSNRPVTFTVKHERLALDYFNGCCAVCGRQLRDLFATHTAAMDHWIPLSKGGHTTPENMVPLCHGIGGCNNLKWGHMPDDWLQSQFGKRKAAEIIARIDAYFAYIKQNTQE